MSLDHKSPARTDAATVAAPRLPAAMTLLSGILAAPCAITLLLTPLGIGGVVAAAGGNWFDQHRAWFIAGSLALIALTHVAYHRMRAVQAAMAARLGLIPLMNPWDRRLVWVATIAALALIVTELLVDQLPR